MDSKVQRGYQRSGFALYKRLLRMRLILDIKLNRFFQIRLSLINSFALARHTELNRPRHIPFSFFGEYHRRSIHHDDTTIPFWPPRSTLASFITKKPPPSGRLYYNTFSPQCMTTINSILRNGLICFFGELMEKFSFQKFSKSL